MKKLLALTAISAVIFANPVFADDNVCETYIPATLKHAVDIFHDTKKSEADKRKALAVIFEDAVDTDWIGKYVLGRFWKTASAEELVEYLKDYRAYLSHSYISKFKDEDGMNIEDIKLASLTPKDAGEFEAKTIIKQKADEDVHVDYLMAQTNGKCKVHDIKLEGVSLLVSQSSEFGTLAGSSGVKGVIDAMKKKIAN